MAKRSRRRTGAGQARGRTASPRARIETSAGGVVYRKDEHGLRLLLIRDPYENWGLPKGHLEGSETPLEAALREVAEETGLTELRAAGELPTIDWYFREQGQLIHKYCHFYLVESPVGEPEPQRAEGITACAWLEPTEAIRTITYENAREVVRIAYETLRADRVEHRS